MDMLGTHSDELRRFVEQVQQRAGLDNYEEAHQLVRATLNVLGQSISGGEAKQLGDWLPPDVRTELTDQSGHASGFDKRNFLEKVGGMVYTVDLEQVEKQVRAALQVARASAPDAERDDLIAQLPPELGDLFR